MNSIQAITPDHTSRAAGRRKPREPLRYQWFDQHLIAKPGPLKVLVENTIRFLDHHERHIGARKRARREQDHQQHLQRIETIVCNLAHAVLLPPPGGRIAAPLGHGGKGRSRYDSPVAGKLLSPTLSLLWDLDFLDVRNPSVVRGEASSIGVSDWFTGKVKEAGVSLADFGRREDEEVIILSRHTRRSTGRDHVVYRAPIDYTDTSETKKHRDDLKGLNAFLNTAEIAFLDDGLEPRIDPFDRTLRRRFVIFSNQKERFDQGGRMFGGFWQNLKSERRRNIRICGEPIAILDYSSMFTRLAYAELGSVPPPGDLYVIPGFESYRSGIKFAMNCFLFDGGPRRAWPDELAIGLEDDLTAARNSDGEETKYEARLPAGATVGSTKEAILSVHPILGRAWDRRLGYRLMFRESEIMMRVLAELAAQNVPALCLHDGLIVPISGCELATHIMSKCALELTGAVFPVADKT
ncbi:hypothetical protein [Hyphomicrobium sp. DMF-1]|jgi:hypothetical protein|uniref:hypothetical protein n=1 Tax=Hyphomicrobium sp. DMF-1 TaxID=3019544 RepID=UPI0022EBDC63|nr:hypothetical protein [Hyphomicrobium sp. DMF-1]WBT39953.1 hypothetical protein PE058_08740 [Hyphomicrobium sp. DMF-1]